MVVVDFFRSNRGISRSQPSQKRLGAMHITHIYGSGVQLEPELKRVQPTGESERRGVASAAGASRPLIGGSDRQISYTAAGCLFTSQAFTPAIAWVPLRP